MARKYSTADQWLHGSGFLARIHGSTFLVTVAHLGDCELAPRADWSLWPDSIFLADTVDVDEEDGLPKRIEEFVLFIEGHKGKRVPRFKYRLRQERPGTIADIILLPLQSDDRIVKMYSSFHLPVDKGDHQPGALVTQLGRRSEFPALSDTEHHSTLLDGPVRLMVPEGQEGDSGGPVINSGGLLLGMNVGSHVNYPNAAMLMSPEAIEALATAVRGVAKGWPQFAPQGPTPTQP
ncbi:hypothetical protein [Pseudarthrobacter sp. ATCC 49987]|uniref:hypothetical protein n=1 Tax=Pseudarthrobacter sp. ATCC 49987 TaxID=2698204 RepID=UPI001370EECF|nr:hypothetical protein [Pseudarthrobacter sp. ATCC 49987]